MNHLTQTDLTEQQGTDKLMMIKEQLRKNCGAYFKAFQFSPAEWQNIHKRLFEGIFSHAGQLRDYNITKKEWVLKGDTITYASFNSIRSTLDYYFQMEKAFSYEGLSIEDSIKHIAIPAQRLCLLSNI